MKRFFVLILALTMLATCTTALVEVTGKGELPIVTQPTKLTVGIVENPRVTSYDDNDFTRYMEEKTGIDLEFVLLPAQDTAAKVKLMFASDDLPDVILGGGIDLASLYDYGDQGMVIPLNEYIEAYGENFQHMIDTAQNKFMLSLLTAPDGNIYYLPTVVEEYHGLYAARSWMYQPWLDTLGLEQPTTTEEFVDVLKAFRDKDPNGNGQQDEIPMTYYNETRYLVRYLMNSFVYFGQTDGMIVNDGVVSPAYFTPEFKAGIEWLNMLVKEKLLDTAAFTQDLNSLKAILNLETPIVGFIPTPWMDGGWMDTQSQRRLDLQFMMPLAGPNGVRYTMPSVPNPSIGFYITYKCENPEVAYRFADYMMDVYVSRLNRYGVEGRDWKFLPEDTAEIALNGEKAKWVDIEEIWQKTTSDAFWWRQGAHFHPLGIFETLSAENPKMAYNKLLVQTAMQLDGLQPEHIVPDRLAMNADELATYTELRSSIDTYLWENITKFIVGDKDIGEWDAFLAEFDKMMLKDFVAAIQTSYTRMSQ